MAVMILFTSDLESAEFLRDTFGVDVMSQEEPEYQWLEDTLVSFSRAIWTFVQIPFTIGLNLIGSWVKSKPGGTDE